MTRTRKTTSKGGYAATDNPKSEMKGIKQMQSTSNLMSTSSRQRASFALLLATVTLLALAPVPARASDEQPFNANFITQFTSVVEFPLLHVSVNSRGQASYMGRTTANTDDQLVNLVDGSGTATYTLTAKNGDTLILALVVPVGEI